jgi:hypothetical protein
MARPASPSDRLIGSGAHQPPGQASRAVPASSAGPLGPLIGTAMAGTAMITNDLCTYSIKILRQEKYFAIMLA